VAALDNQQNKRKTAPKDMYTRPEKIRWAPKIRPKLLKKLYDTDALRIQDIDLCDDVGLRLYLRCQTIIRAHNREAECPRCGLVFKVHDSWKDPVDKIAVCPKDKCGWQITFGQYFQSKRHREIFAGNAVPVFKEYYVQYPLARSYREKMLLIDSLIHSFHVNLKTNLPGRSTANNLIEGNHKMVLEFLEGLSAVDSEKKREWGDRVKIMQIRRKGKG
jgi:hypothetical protein